jgi:hypothetical protein
MVKRYQRLSKFELWFFRICSEKKQSGLLFLDLDWHSFFWISAHRHRIITIFIIYHLHQPPLSCYAFLPWFDQVLLDFAMFWIESLSLGLRHLLQWEPLLENQAVCVSHSRYAIFCLVSFAFIIIFTFLLIRNIIDYLHWIIIIIMMCIWLWVVCTIRGILDWTFITLVEFNLSFSTLDWVNCNISPKKWEKVSSNLKSIFESLL